MITKDRSLLPMILSSLTALMMLVMFAEKAQSKVPSIKCETAFGEKAFIIDDAKVAFLKEDSQTRKISSLEENKVRTHKTVNGFKKVLYVDGNKHTINIDNAAEFSEVNDYMSVVSPKGHTMTYSLKCDQA
jgi:hypothetical protein